MKIAGFKAAAVQAGLRKKDRLDVGLIVGEGPVSAAGVFTRNRVQAAPVLWSRRCLGPGRARAILVNSGQANACTGPEGLEAASRSASALAAALGCPAEEILLASTGVIGEPLNLAALTRAVPALVAGLSEDGLGQVARAMMTTDTRPKTAEAEGVAAGRPFHLAGMAKGSGMIAPNMATMLSFILTDAAIEPAALQMLLAQAAESTFNAVTVDGDTSTNDTVFLLAGGRAGFPPLTRQDPGLDVFRRVLTDVMADLARQIAADGEGATKLVTIRVAGAASDEQAKAAALTVANSPLVKTAFFGQDPNWGRIMMALGRSPAEFDPLKVRIDFDEVAVVREGRQAAREEDAARVMKRPVFTVAVDLSAGPGRAEVLTCDLSHDYVKINADYRS